MGKVRVAIIIDRIGFLEIFSIPILSAVAKARGHEVRLIEIGRNFRNSISDLKQFAPDVIAYSICSTEAEKYLIINRLVRKEIEAFSLFGGPHPTFFPALVKEEGVDGICRGEGDITFPDFLDSFGTDRMYEVGNFSFKLDSGKVQENPLAFLIENLDTLPFPDREILYSQSTFLSRSPIKSFFTGRGCPYKCSYCFNHIFNRMYRNKGRILRSKSIDYLFHEINGVRKRYPLSFVKFHDDIFGLDKEWLAMFAERYPKEIGLPFLCYSRPNIVDEDYCRLLKHAGCYSVCVAIEAGNEEIRNRILDRNMTDAQIIIAWENFKKYGIRTYSLNMLGLPGETESAMFQTVTLNQSLGVDFADSSIFQPYPGTKIAEYCLGKGYLKETLGTTRSQYDDSILQIDPKLKQRIYVLHKMFPVLVDHHSLKFLLPLLFAAKPLRPLLNLIYRLYYGYNLHKKIYASAIPFSVIWKGIFALLFSRGRT